MIRKVVALIANMALPMTRQVDAGRGSERNERAMSWVRRNQVVTETSEETPEQHFIVYSLTFRLNELRPHNPDVDGVLQ